MCFGNPIEATQAGDITPTVICNIVQLWANVEQDAPDAITTRQAVRLRNLDFTAESDILFITLPSGRRLTYVKPQLGENRWGGTSIIYSGVTTGRKWGRLETAASSSRTSSTTKSSSPMSASS